MITPSPRYYNTYFSLRACKYFRFVNRYIVWSFYMLWIDYSFCIEFNFLLYILRTMYCCIWISILIKTFDHFLRFKSYSRLSLVGVWVVTSRFVLEFYEYQSWDSVKPKYLLVTNSYKYLDLMHDPCHGPKHYFYTIIYSYNSVL